MSIMEFLYDSDELTPEQIQEYEELYYASDSAEYDYDAKLAITMKKVVAVKVAWDRELFGNY